MDKKLLLQRYIMPGFSRLESPDSSSSSLNHKHPFEILTTTTILVFNYQSLIPLTPITTLKTFKMVAAPMIKPSAGPK
jgi:hypothetical protein